MAINHRILGRLLDGNVFECSGRNCTEPPRVEVACDYVDGRSRRTATHRRNLCWRHLEEWVKQYLSAKVAAEALEEFRSEMALIRD